MWWWIGEKKKKEKERAQTKDKNKQTNTNAIAIHGHKMAKTWDKEGKGDRTTIVNKKTKAWRPGHTVPLHVPQQ